MGLVVLTEVPGNPGPALVAVLQRRGEWNTEKMAPESYPGACQVTVHGKVEKGESPSSALFREIDQELGAEALEFLRRGALGPEHDFPELLKEETPDKLVITWGMKVPCELLRVIRLGPDSGGLRLLEREEVAFIANLNNFDKKEGVMDRTDVAMFPDEIEAVKKAFEAFA